MAKELGGMAATFYLPMPKPHEKIQSLTRLGDRLILGPIPSKCTIEVADVPQNPDKMSGKVSGLNLIAICHRNRDNCVDEPSKRRTCGWSGIVLAVPRPRLY
jgi:hypothetical protein